MLLNIIFLLSLIHHNNGSPINMLNSITSVLAASTAFTSGFVHPGRLASTALTSGNLIELDHHKNFNQGKFSKHAKFQKKQRRPSKQTKWQNDDLSSSENNEITSTLPIKVDPSILPTPSEKSPIISEHLLFGGASDISQTIVRSSYIVNYNKARKCANFVAEHISKESMKQVKFDRPKFSQDDEIDPMYRSIDADYLGSGFDRGHLVACGNHKESKRHYDDTFKFSNAVPQNHQMNTGKWNVLENWVRDTLIPKYDDLYIITGPLFLPTVEGDKQYIKYQVLPNGTPVPTHLFKVVAGVKNGKFQIESFVMENTEIPLNKILRDFVIDLKTLESKSGLTFFPEIQSNLDNDSLCDENGCNV